MKREGSMMRPAALSIAAVVAMGAAMVAFSGSSGAAVSAVRGEAFGYSLSVTLFGGGPFIRGFGQVTCTGINIPAGCVPAANAADSDSPSVALTSNGSNTPQTDSQPSVVAVVGPATFLATGTQTVNTQGTTGPTGSVSTTANIANISTTGGGQLAATNLASSCTSSSTGVVSGTTTVTGGVLVTDGGLDLDNDGDFTDAGEHAPVTVAVPANPAANSAPITGHIHANDSQDNFTYRFNEQITNPDGSLTVYAAHQVFTGPTAVGDLFIGKAQCGLTGTPDPTTGPPTSPPTTPPPPPPPPPSGTQYVMVAKDGGVFAPGGEGFFGTARLRPGGGILRDSQGRIIGASGSPLDSPVVGFAYTPSRHGYWLAQGDGSVIPIGDAPDVGDVANLPLNSPIVGVAATEDGEGLYLVAADGGVFALGTAPFLGSLDGIALAKPVVGIGLDTDGSGYYLVAADGGVFAYDAQFRGSLGATPPVSPVVGIAVTVRGGYVLAASDGGAFPYGAPFAGNLVGLPLAGRIVGIAADPDGAGYWMAGADGGVFAFDADFVGSVASILLNAPISGIAAL